MKAAAVLFMALLLPLPSLHSQIVDETPRLTAMEWLALVDEGKYGESWKQASALFQKAIGEEEWIKQISASRKKMGSLEKRIFVDGRYLRDPAGLPKGDYFALRFLTEFKTVKVLELVVPMMDETGRWQVANYSVTPNIPGEKKK